ncbi:MAG: SpoIIE family protein phosphatase [Desulfococcaceae bacterium]
MNECINNTDDSPLILIADDDMVMHSIFKYHLKKAGFETAAVTNGKDALEAMSEKTAVVLMDLHMPVMDGITCLRGIRQRFEHVSVIMITASDNVSDAVEAMKYGASDYLIKPVKPVELVALVEKNVKNWTRSRRFRQMENELARARETELSISSKIQQTLLMGIPPRDISGLRISHLSVPSRKVDGDFFDFYKISQSCLDIMVGDVMGKGVAAALLGAAVKSHFLRAINGLLLSNECRKHPEPAEIVDWANSEMIYHLKEIESFVTLCYARLDLKKFCMDFVDCGHVRTIHFHSGTGNVRMLEGINIPLGISDPDPFEQVSVPFEPGDLFFFCSDGLTEAENPEGELYGEERLADFIRKNAQKPPDQLISAVREDIISFSGTVVFKDDFTCVAVSIDKT